MYKTMLVENLFFAFYYWRLSDLYISSEIVPFLSELVYFSFTDSDLIDNLYI